jgi:hypothetical protein
LVYCLKRSSIEERKSIAPMLLTKSCLTSARFLLLFAPSSGYATCTPPLPFEVTNAHKAWRRLRLLIGVVRHLNRCTVFSGDDSIDESKEAAQSKVRKERRQNIHSTLSSKQPFTKVSLFIQNALDLWTSQTSSLLCPSSSISPNPCLSSSSAASSASITSLNPALATTVDVARALRYSDLILNAQIRTRLAQQRIAGMRLFSVLLNELSSSPAVEETLENVRRALVAMDIASTRESAPTASSSPASPVFNVLSDSSTSNKVSL